MKNHGEDGWKPQVKHHFSLLDQVNALVGARDADPEVGFMARLLALCILPRTNPGEQYQYKRINGPYQLILSRTGDYRLPFGNLPRLLLAWVCTEAVRTQSRELVLGRSLSEFMRKMDILSSDSGGAWGIRTRLRNQMDRLFHATVQLMYKDEKGTASVGSLIADRTELWWDPKSPDEAVLWESKLRLGEEFFNEIIRRPVPLDIHILKALKRSPLGLDLYMWLVYRTFALNRQVQISWPMLYRQFGADPSRATDNCTVQDFRKDCLRELKKIQTAWPGLNYGTAKGVLFLRPSEPSVPRLTLVE